MRGVVRTVLARVAEPVCPASTISTSPSTPTRPAWPLQAAEGEVPRGDDHRAAASLLGLAVNDDRFEVKLTFDGIPERLLVPFDAIKVFFDPSVPYGLQFEDLDMTGAAAQELAGPQRESRKPRRRWVNRIKRRTLLRPAPTRSHARRAGRNPKGRRSEPLRPAPTKPPPSLRRPWPNPPRPVRRRTPRLSASTLSARNKQRARRREKQ